MRARSRPALDAGRKAFASCSEPDRSRRQIHEDLAGERALLVERVIVLLDAEGAGGGHVGPEPLIRYFTSGVPRVSATRAGAIVHGMATGTVTSVVALNGVFTRLDDGAVRFHPGPAPSVADVAAVVKRVAERMLRWMRRRRMFDQRPPEERSNEAPEVHEQRRRRLPAKIRRPPPATRRSPPPGPWP